MNRFSTLIALTLAGLSLGACSSAQDAAVVAKVQQVNTVITADVAALKAAIASEVQIVCPSYVANLGSTTLLTTFVGVTIGLPATGTVVVGLETAVATVCKALLAKATPTAPAAPVPPGTNPDVPPVVVKPST